MLSWAFITAHREGIDWLPCHRNESIGLAPTILELLEQEWLSETPSRAEARLEALRTCLKALPEKSS